jgi:hypothetical protein
LIKKGGQTGQMSPALVPIPATDTPVQTAYLHYVDERIAYVVVRLRSGSAFSLGKLFATEDGGRTWQERSLPGGEAVKFLDPQLGWTTARSPSGTLLYRTTDGGRSWTAQPLPLSASEMHTGLPRFLNDRRGLLPVVLPSQGESRLILLQTVDKGGTWQVLDEHPLPGAMTGGETDTFSAVSPNHWWITSNGKLMSLGKDGQLNTFDLPGGVISLDFWDEQQGWVLVQEGYCLGEKAPLGSTGRAETDPLICQQFTRLMSTMDGGTSWTEISPIPGSPIPMEP